MKKTFTMFFAVAITFAAAAQPVYKNERKAPVYTQHAGTEISFSKQAELREIDRKFEHEAMLVKTDRFAGRKEKALRLARLEDHRNADIRRVERFYDMRRHSEGPSYSSSHTHNW